MAKKFTIKTVQCLKPSSGTISDNTIRLISGFAGGVIGGIIGAASGIVTSAATVAPAAATGAGVGAAVGTAAGPAGTAAGAGFGAAAGALLSTPAAAGIIIVAGGAGAIAGTTLGADIVLAIKNQITEFADGEDDLYINLNGYKFYPESDKYKGIYVNEIQDINMSFEFPINNKVRIDIYDHDTISANDLLHAFEIFSTEGDALHLRTLPESDASSIYSIAYEIAEDINIPEPLITVYEHAEYRGRFQNFGHGSHDLTGNNLNDNISSIKIKAGYKVTVYEHPDRDLPNQAFTNDVTDLRNIGESWNDMISRLKIEKL